MNKVLLFSLIILVLVPFSNAALEDSVELDAFYTSRIMDMIDTIPQQTLDLCRAEVQNSQNKVFERVDARIEGVPWLVTVGAFTGMILGVFLGNFVSLFLQKNYRLRSLRVSREIREELRNIKAEVQTLKDEIRGG